MELVVGLVLLAAAGLAGLVFVHRPFPNRLDAAGFAALPAEPSSPGWHEIADLGSLPVLLAGVGICFVLVVWRDRSRALACLTGPAAAVAVAEWVAKPLVGRHLTVLGANSYPSGTVTAVAALAMVVVLVAPRLLRPLAGLVGLAALLATSAAVIAMRWHFPTDTLGGACIGIGAVLVTDAAFHVRLPAKDRRSRAPLPADEARHPAKRALDARAS